MATSGPITTEELRAHIRRVVDAGQSYTLPGGRTVTNVNIDKLDEMLKSAEMAETRQKRGVFVLGSFGRPQ